VWKKVSSSSYLGRPLSQARLGGLDLGRMRSAHSPKMPLSVLKCPREPVVPMCIGHVRGQAPCLTDRAAVGLVARRHLVLSHLSVVCRRLSSSVGQTFLSLPGTRNCSGNPAFSSLLKACPRQPRLLDRPRFRRKSSSYRAILPAGVRSRCSDGFRLLGRQISSLSLLHNQRCANLLPQIEENPRRLL